MSRIGKQPIKIPQGVNVTLKGNLVEVKGPKGQLSLEHNENVRVEQKDGEGYLENGQG